MRWEIAKWEYCKWGVGWEITLRNRMYSVTPS